MASPLLGETRMPYPYPMGVAIPFLRETSFLSFLSVFFIIIVSKNIACL